MPVRQTTCETKFYDRETDKWEISPAGTDVLVITDREIDTYCDKQEAYSVRECARRMRANGDRVVFGFLGNVRCYTVGVFTNGSDERTENSDRRQAAEPLAL